MTALLVTALVTIVVHNAAGVPDAELITAKAGVERLLATGGVTVVWADMADPAGFSIHLMLRRQPGQGPGSTSPAALGTTIGEDHAYGGRSFVFYERILGFAHAHHFPVASILALVIVHEVGHVLLPAPAHTATGLMRAEWSEDDLRHLEAGAAPFTAMQSTLMKAAVTRGLGLRLGASESTRPGQLE
jgi:hypothetical protein